MKNGTARSSLGCACLGLVSGQQKFLQNGGGAQTVLSGCHGDAVGCHGAVPNRLLLLLGAPRAGGIIPDDVLQSYIPEGPHCLGWVIPAGDSMALFGCEIQEEEFEITLRNLGLPLAYSDMLLEGTGDLIPPLVWVQKVALTSSRLLQ